MATGRQTLHRMMREEAPFTLHFGKVVGSNNRGLHNVVVRGSGGRVWTRTYNCVSEPLEAGDEVVVLRAQNRERVIVLAKVLSPYSSDLSRHGVLAPPNNLTAQAMPGGIILQWDAYPGSFGGALCYEVQHNSSTTDPGSNALVTRGSYYLYHIIDENTDAGTPVQRFFRVRSVRWIGPNNVMYSGWSAWTETTTVTWDGRYRTETELASVANAEGASMIGIEDADDHYTSTDVEGALAEIGSGAVGVGGSAEGALIWIGW